jgi:AraC family transcriptional regulator
VAGFILGCSATSHRYDGRHHSGTGGSCNSRSRTLVGSTRTKRRCETTYVVLRPTRPQVYFTAQGAHGHADRQVIAMITTQLSTFRTRDERCEAGRTALHHFEQFELRSTVASRQTVGSDLLDSTVQIYPADSVKRDSASWGGIVTETVYAPTQSRVEFRFDAPVHLLVMYDYGARREGETSISELAPSRLRNFAHKLTFAPAGHTYREWHETGMPIHITYFYLDPIRLQQRAETEAVYAPRVFFEDPILWETAAKLRSVIKSRRSEGGRYSEALANVLVHELSRSGHDRAQETQASRGGLTGWQMRAITSYIEEHLEEETSLITLARIARLSQYHFCRAFKQSFGIPPHRYHVHRRIERAKILMADRQNSVTSVGLTLGYSQASSFTVAFRKITGQKPSEFRRNLA